MSHPNHTSDETYDYPASGGTSVDPVNGRRTIWRGRYRGMVPQIGRPPAIDPLTGQTQAQKNAENIMNPNVVAWDKTFPTLPNGQPRGGAPNASEGQTWQERFPRLPNGQSRGVLPPVAAQTPPQPATAMTPPAAPTPSPIPAAAHSAPAPQNPLAPVQVPYGTITPAHTWQQSLTAKYPEIGQAGTPHNQAFVEAFKMHNDPNKAMQTADEVMRLMRGPQVPPPSNRVDPLASI